MLAFPRPKCAKCCSPARVFTARELEPTGFFNYVLPREEVVPRALEIARRIAAKSLPSIRARKVASARLEGMTWTEAYLDAQQLSAALTAGSDGGEGVRAFLAGRDPNYQDC
ncbi:enoyl-CoA hydratase/isomerase family protein [Novosphingobium colocasiae]